MDISMDIHRKPVDMDMDMDGKFHIHGKPGAGGAYSAPSDSSAEGEGLVAPSPGTSAPLSALQASGFSPFGPRLSVPLIFRPPPELKSWLWP